MDILNGLHNGLGDGALGGIQQYSGFEPNGCQIDHRIESTFIYPIRVEHRSNASLSLPASGTGKDDGGASE